MSRVSSSARSTPRISTGGTAPSSKGSAKAKADGGWSPRTGAKVGDPAKLKPGPLDIPPHPGRRKGSDKAEVKLKPGPLDIPPHPGPPRRTDEKLKPGPLDIPPHPGRPRGGGKKQV